jgi:hypothetical protein
MLNMFKKNLWVWGIAFCLAGCLDVEDKSDGKVVDALEAQNELLQQQLEQASQQKSSVTLSASVTDIGTGAPAGNASATLSFAGGTSQTVDINNGSFQFPNVPVDSDYELMIRSKTGEFLERTFYGRTRANTAAGAVFQDLGKLEVAPGVERSFAVFDNVTGEPISTLVFHVNYNQGSGSNAESKYIKASYDETTKRYKIIVPEAIMTVISASLDLDHDGINDYQIVNNPSEKQLQILSETLIHYDNFFLIDQRTAANNSKENIELRISVVDDYAQPIPDLTLSVKDMVNGIVNAVYDTATDQYVLKAILSDRIEVMLPAFSHQGKYFSSSNLVVERASQTNTYNVWAGYSTEVTFAADEARIFNAVMSPSVQTVYSNVRVASKSNSLDVSNPEYKVFYTSPVSLLPVSVKLYQTNKVTVTPGDQSPNDLVLPGVTEVMYGRYEVPASASLSLNDTLLTAIPQTDLAPGNIYEFVIDELMDKGLGTAINVNDDNLTFSAPAQYGEFDINELRLDNNNNFTNGGPIKTQNTAGQVVVFSAWESQYSNNVSIYLPPSVASLKSLSLRKLSVIQNNVTSHESQLFTLIENANLNIWTIYALPLASNESLRMSGDINIHRGVSLTEGYWFHIYSGEYMPDNRPGYQNQITFSYSYETKAGDISTGTITLPVQ